MSREVLSFQEAARNRITRDFRVLEFFCDFEYGMNVLFEGGRFCWIVGGV